jgi:transposase
MMGRQDRDQGQLFYEFKLDEVIPKNHLLRRINVFVTTALFDLHEQLKPFYSEIGRPSVDPELMIRMLIVGYCYGIRSERKLCEEVRLHLAYRWFCRLDEQSLRTNRRRTNASLSPILAAAPAAGRGRFRHEHGRTGKSQSAGVSDAAPSTP